MLGNKIPNSNYQNSKSWFWSLGFWSLFIICNLVLGIWNLSLAQEQFVYDAKGKRDPFIPLVSSDGRFTDLDKEGKKGELSVEGIIYDRQGNSYAIINGSVIRIGDVIAGYQVMNIEADKVIFIKGDQIVEEKINKESK